MRKLRLREVNSLPDPLSFHRPTMHYLLNVETQTSQPVAGQRHRPFKGKELMFPSPHFYGYSSTQYSWKYLHPISKTKGIKNKKCYGLNYPKFTALNWESQIIREKKNPFLPELFSQSHLKICRSLWCPGRLWVGMLKRREKTGFSAGIWYSPLRSGLEVLEIPPCNCPGMMGRESRGCFRK